jgi:hypothetical protein
MVLVDVVAFAERSRKVLPRSRVQCLEQVFAPLYQSVGRKVVVTMHSLSALNAILFYRFVIPNVRTFRVRIT